MRMTVDEARLILNVKKDDSAERILQVSLGSNSYCFHVLIPAKLPSCRSCWIIRW